MVSVYEPIRTPGPRLAEPFESLHLVNLARFAVHTRKPSEYLLDIEYRYRRMQIDLPELRRSLDGISAGVTGLDESSKMWSISVKALTRIQAAYTMLLTMALISNQVLQGFAFDDIAFVNDAADFCTEILRIAEEAVPFRPFGSSAQPFALVAVEVTSTDEVVKDQARHLQKAEEMRSAKEWDGRQHPRHHSRQRSSAPSLFRPPSPFHFHSHSPRPSPSAPPASSLSPSPSPSRALALVALQ